VAVIDKIDERLLSRIWRRQLVDGECLVASSGGRVRVIYPGMENSDSGPDFRDAVVGTGSGLTIGDVEIHLRDSDWRSHGHNRDPRYNGVILHVVWEGESPVELQKGGSAQTLCLRHCLKGALEEVRWEAFLDMWPDEPCHGAAQRVSVEELGQLLDEAGDERFRQKAERFKGEMEEETRAQVLYRGIMGALGYTRNRERFEELAGRLPWAMLEGICCGKPPFERVRALQSLLSGAAGLLLAGEGGNFEPAVVSCWECFRVRPENNPRHRLVGAAHLLARFIGEGLVEGAMRLVKQCGEDVKRLEDGFVVLAGESFEGREHALIGRGRAREMMVNIILPFTRAWAEVSKETSLAEQALRLYRACPRTGENQLTRRLTTLLFGGSSSKVVNSARRQQGLIHLEKSFCGGRKCWECPIGQRMAS
jgi:hypothetical protein